ncbi:uncharacterized protein [Rutidosis leptorrhynchoides]|uniref:uncharacterized protein n=1 Tax=Rutidosis leptorrhynchoides TaxID=125765 RepID=UPI003A99D3CC
MSLGHFMGGHIEGIDSEIAIVNAYGPHSTAKKIRFWESLEKLLGFGDMPWLLCGDFIEVRNQLERLNSDFNKCWADRFNQFIRNNCLIKVPLGGKKFTRICDNGVKFSMLDRFLVSEQFIHLWLNISAVTLDKHLSDHCPILLSNGIKDFGPKPTRIFNEWLLLDGAVDVIVNVSNTSVVGSRPDCIFWNKLNSVKQALKNHSLILKNLSDQILNHSKAVSRWEVIAEGRPLTYIERKSWLEEKKQWIAKEHIQLNMLKQKSKIKWKLEGDENSSFFHNVIKRRGTQAS